MLRTYDQKFDVARNLENFYELNKSSVVLVSMHETAWMHSLPKNFRISVL